MRLRLWLWRSERRDVGGCRTRGVGVSLGDPVRSLSVISGRCAKLLLHLPVLGLFPFPPLPLCLERLPLCLGTLPLQLGV